MLHEIITIGSWGTPFYLESYYYINFELARFSSRPPITLSITAKVSGTDSDSVQGEPRGVDSSGQYSGALQQSQHQILRPTSFRDPHPNKMEGVAQGTMRR